LGGLLSAPAGADCRGNPFQEFLVMLSDIEIAQNVNLKPILELAKNRLDIDPPASRALRSLQGEDISRFPRIGKAEARWKVDFG
jgi:hypothetical protein